MGYPMTYGRVMSRNALSGGDYDKPPAWEICGINRKPEALIMWAEEAGKRIERVSHQLQGLCGDLRRLERDATDERYLCENIAQRTGVAVDDVAAVLKEFFSL